MHASGACTSYAGIGFLINAPVIDGPWSTFDASGRNGVNFWVKGPPYVRVLLHMPATVATQYHGTCATPVCMGAVTRNFYLSPNVRNYIQFTFASLTSGNVPFDPAQLTAVESGPSTWAHSISGSTSPILLACAAGGASGEGDEPKETLVLSPHLAVDDLDRRVVLDPPAHQASHVSPFRE